jgi:hypothetical protein
MLRALIALIVTATPVLWNSAALAWNDYGHQLSAAIAWQELKPEIRTKVSTILKAHPQYDLLSERCPSGFDLDQFVFMRASTWPDMVRDRGNPLQRTEHKGPWHYINLPIELGSVKGPQPKLEWKPGAEPENIVQAIAKCEADLKDDQVTTEEKSKRLCWVLHLVGDIHQPLHAVSLFSPQFPTGDQGGNLFFVAVDGSPEKLHALWDNALGKSRDSAAIAARARKLTDAAALDMKRTPGDRKRQSSPAEWAQESKTHATYDAYLNGELKGAKGGRDPDQAGGPVPALPQDYRGKAEKVSEKRIVLAGYRMAERVSARFAKP